jgi:hypothetical protein
MLDALRQILGRAEQNLGGNVNNVSRAITGHALFGGAPMRHDSSDDLIAPKFSFEQRAPMLGPNGQPQGQQPLQVHPGTGLQQTASPDGIQPYAQGPQASISGGYINPQIMQGNQGLQGQFGAPDTSYSGGADGQAGFPAFLQNLLRRN